MELELQLVNTNDYDLAPTADMLRLMKQTRCPAAWCPDDEQHDRNLHRHLPLGQRSGAGPAHASAMRWSKRRQAQHRRGGRRHAPFQQWHERRIYDKPRFRELSELYGYLSSSSPSLASTCTLAAPMPMRALLMLHRMSRYIPHFIALSASSPYVQGQDTAFDSARLNSVFAFPLSGRAPFALTWDDFTAYFDKMTRTGVVKA